MYTNILLFIIFNIIYVCVSQFFLFSLEWFPQQIIQRYCFFNLNSGVHRNFSVGRRGGGLTFFFFNGGAQHLLGPKNPFGSDGKMMRLAFPPSLFWLLLFCCSTRDEDPDWFGDLNTRAKTKENKFFILFLFLAFYVSFDIRGLE